MIPKLLRIKAFASYKNEQIIDFEKLGANEIFLIHGKTGSGKTAILDAITYALYEQSSGGERGGIENMRCKNIGARDIPTELEFIFEIKDRRYKFIRKIYERKKRNGDTEFVSEHNALFYKDGAFFPFFENPTKTRVNEKARELIGLSCSQFLQVAILPQGKFEKFLVSSSLEKEEILVTLFQIDDWNSIGEWIYKQGMELENGCKELRGNIAGLLKQLECGSPEEISDGIAFQEKLIEQKEKMLEAVLKSSGALSEELEALRLLSARFEKRELLKKRNAELFKLKDDIEALSLRLKRNEDAKSIAPVYEALIKLSRQLSERRSVLGEEDNKLKRLEDAQKDFEKQLAQLQSEQAEISALEKKLVLWGGMEKHYYAVNESQNSKKALTNQRVQLLKDIEAKSADEKSVIEKRASLILKREEILSVYQAQIDFKKTERSGLEQSLRLEEEIKKGEITKAGIQSKLEDVVNSIASLAKKKKAAEAEHERVYSLYISSLAQNLSSLLCEGMPCPVCGSVHHPAPAIGGGGENYEADLKRLKSDISAFDNQLGSLVGEKNGFESRLENGVLYISERKEQLKGLPAADVSRLGKVSDFISRAEAEIAVLPQITEKLSLLENELAVILEKKNGLSQMLSAIEASLCAAEEKLRLSKEQLDGEFSDINSLNAAISSAQRRINEYNDKSKSLEQAYQKSKEDRSAAQARLERASEELQRCESEHSDSELRLQAALLENNFSLLSDYLSAAVSQEEAAGLQKEYDDYYKQLSFVQTSLGELEEELKGVSPPDISNKTVELEKLQAEKSALQADTAVLKEKYERFRNNALAYTKLYAELEEKTEQSKRLKGFGGELRGDRGIGLRRFVLGIMLENVIFEANRILSGIKGGQFRLKIKPPDKINQKAGLDLLIESTKTDEAYDVAALSGGEKFLVAISLSLALSAVVQMQAGGVSIDAMFIDEGFGSLDPSALDEAMEILVGIKGTKRLFGIISHVEAMKETIQSKLEVINDREGSHIRSSFGA